jgi:hypothetical protein
MSESIFTPAAVSRRSIHWPSAYPRTATARTCAAAIHTSTTIATSHDAHLVAILDAPLRDGEPAHVGFARKERELGEAFGALPIFDQRAMYARLANPKPADQLAEKFMRLTAERRTRLLNFLGDARRRAALSKAR